MNRQVSRRKRVVPTFLLLLASLVSMAAFNPVRAATAATTCLRAAQTPIRQEVDEKQSNDWWDVVSACFAAEVSGKHTGVLSDADFAAIRARAFWTDLIQSQTLQCATLRMMAPDRTSNLLYPNIVAHIPLHCLKKRAVSQKDVVTAAQARFSLRCLSQQFERVLLTLIP